MIVVNTQPNRISQKAMTSFQVFIWHSLSHTLRAQSEVTQKAQVAECKLDAVFHVYQQFTKTQRCKSE